MRFFLAFIPLLLLSSCDSSDAKLIVINNTSDTIFYYVQPTKQVLEQHRPFYYTDHKEDYLYENCLFINQNKRDEMINSTWEDYIEELPDKKIKIIYFKKQLLDTTSWKRIVDEQLMSGIVELDVNDLEELNWVVSLNEDSKTDSLSRHSH